MIRLLDSVPPPPNTSSRLAGTQKRHAHDLCRLIIQFYQDILRILAATREDELCSEEHCRLFNSLVERTILVIRTSDYEANQEASWLRLLRLKPVFGPWLDRPKLSVLLTKIGHLKAYLESKIDSPTPSTSPSNGWFTVSMFMTTVLGLIMMALALKWLAT